MKTNEDLKNQEEVINEKVLLNRDKANWRSVNKSGVSGYIGPDQDYAKYRKALDRQMKWVKDNYWIYAIPFNVNYEADYIRYLDSLPSLKPYIRELIRKEMKNPYVNKKARVREYYKGDDTKRRSFSLKFSKEKEADIIEYLQTKESKRSYLIGLIEQDMIDTGYKPSKALEEYNKENKIKRKNIHRELYAALYYYIEDAINSGRSTIGFRELLDAARKRVGNDLKQTTYSAYRRVWLSETGALTVIPGTTDFKIHKREFQKLEKPEVER